MHCPDLKPTRSTTVVTIHIKFVLPVNNLTWVIRSSTDLGVCIHWLISSFKMETASHYDDNKSGLSSKAIARDDTGFFLTIHTSPFSVRGLQLSEQQRDAYQGAEIEAT